MASPFQWVSDVWGIVKVIVMDCPGKSWWLASTRSIVTLCWPGGKSLMSMVPVLLASAQCQGRPSTLMCRWPTRGKTLRAAGPKTGEMRTFSARYWIRADPWASAKGMGGSTIDDQLDRVDVGRIIRSQKQNSFCLLFSLTPASQGDYR